MQRVKIYNDLLHLTGERMNADICLMEGRKTAPPPPPPSFSSFFSLDPPLLPYLYSYTYQNRNKSWKPECVGSFNMDWRILVNFIPRFWLGIKH